MCRSAHHDDWRLGIGQKNPYIDLGVTVQGSAHLSWMAQVVNPGAAGHQSQGTR